MSTTQPKMAIRTKSESLSTKYTVMFDSDIEESSEHHEQFYVMEQAGKEDLVQVCISSLGGSVATISKFQDVVKNSDAHFHAKLHGYGYSAGGALFLLCDTQEVSDLATFMAHSMQTGYGGGTQAIEAHSKMCSKQNEQLCRMLYTDFLSEEEIVRICDGAEIWMEAEEIRERLTKRETIRNQQAIEEAKETYTPEVYAVQCVQDIVEDCASFEYDPVKVIEAMLEEARSLTTATGEDLDTLAETVGMVRCTSEEEEVEVVEVTPELVSTSHLEDLKYYAKCLGIPFAHNISIERLRQRILDFLPEED